MTRTPTLLMLVAGFTLLGCSETERSPAEVEPAPDAAPATDVDEAAEPEGEPIEATSFRGEPLERNPVPADRLAEIDSAIQPLEEKGELSEDDYIELGRLYIAANRFRDSIDLYTRGLEQYPESFRLRRHRGHRYINLRDLDSAIVDLREAVDLIGDEHTDVLEYDAEGEPTATYEHWVWYHVGLYHYLNEEWEDAADAYRNCVETATNNGVLVGATDWLYNALMKGGMTEAAAEALTAVPPDLDTNQEHPYFKRVMVYQGEIEPSEVLDVDKPASEWSGFDITAGYGIGNWYRFNGDEETANRIHQKILETPYWNAWAYVVTDREYSRRQDD